MRRGVVDRQDLPQLASVITLPQPDRPARIYRKKVALPRQDLPQLASVITLPQPDLPARIYRKKVALPEGRPDSLYHPVRGTHSSVVNPNPFTQKFGHPPAAGASGITTGNSVRSLTNSAI
jgi:hypothetical protein